MKVGYHKLDITPDNSVFQAGYNRKLKSEGVLDPIEINTIIFESSFKKIVICLLDSIIIEDSIIEKVKDKVQTNLHIEKQYVTIGCIHTHSAPAYFKPYFEEVTVEKDLQINLVDQMYHSIKKAINNIEDCSIKITNNTIDGVYGNRNIKDGIANKQFFMLHCYNQQKDLKCIFGNLACHPTILNGDNQLLSADLFGQLRKDLSNQYHCPIMLSNSYAGDVSTRFYRQHSGVKELERVSLEIIKQLHIQEEDVLCRSINTSTICKEYTLDTKIDTDHLWMRQTLERNIGETDNQNLISNYQMMLRCLVIKEQNSPMTLKLSSNIYFFGSLFIITLPGDVTSILGKRIEEALSDYTVIILGYCENYSNYLVCEEDYGKYFESYITRLAKGKADAFVDSVIESAKSLLK
ncbi:MAG: neutral/alkaline non-lysosomal ceramidase N-terminal domain-containing protein [Coprobacillaceae bacterium]